MKARPASAPRPDELPFRRQRILAAGLLAVFAPVPLVFSYALGAPALLLYLAALGVFLVFVLRGRIVSLPDWALNVVGLGLFALFVADFRFGARNLLTATLHVLLAATVVKFASVRRERDFSTLLVLAVFLFLGSAATSFHAAILPFVLGYAVLTWVVLARWSLWRELAGAPSELSRDPSAARLPGAGATAGAVGACALLAVPFFVLLPRVRTPMVQGPGASREVWTGFSETVDPGIAGPMKLSDRVFLRIEPGRGFIVEEAADLRIRALAFSSWTGKTWVRPPGSGRALGPALENFVALAGRKRGRVGAESLRMLIDLAPLGSRYLPVPDRTTDLRLTSVPFRILGAFVERDALGNLRVPVEPDRPIQYEVLRAATAVPDLSAPSPADGTREPPGLPRLGDLVRDVSGGDPAARPFEAARALEDHFARRYVYALDAPMSGEKPVEEFVFRTKRGHCESFATAMVLALREAGIPARLVTGFLGGEAGLFGRYVLVRGRNAHAWVEAWCGPERGWTTFDPTPPAGRPVFERASMLQQLRNSADGLEFLYDRYVLSFGQADQVELARRIRERFSGAVQIAGELAAGGAFVATALGPLVGVFLLGAVILGLVRRLARRRRDGIAFVSGLPPAADAYRSLQRTLRRAGARLTPASAPAETLEAADTSGPLASEVAREIVMTYVEESYGQRPVGSETRSRLRRLLREFRRSVRTLHRASRVKGCV